ncbi:hypothetical protein GXM_09766 [Nostoc sphaeroides CCNUC1]|uniref:Uncharacterized protein n=1 Tax=Nostoc sphaeroides CCNUC1 TaxID=2653204 RepID=A0A5P8WIK9_9NOSO|nr:hypothetical protein GXM_09766 [Nostoc sphaeroides CCNUC1]
MDSSFIYITRTRYSKGWKQIATAFLDASNCCCQECDRIPAMNQWHRFCLIPGEKPHCFTQIVHEYIDTRNYPYK